MLAKYSETKVQEVDNDKPSDSQNEAAKTSSLISLDLIDCDKYVHQKISIDKDKITSQRQIKIHEAIDEIKVNRSLNISESSGNEKPKFEISVEHGLNKVNQVIKEKKKQSSTEEGKAEIWVASDKKNFEDHDIPRMTFGSLAPLSTK